MSYDGSGTYTPPSPEYPAVAGSLIKSADFNGIVTDIAAALSLALVRDGRAPMTGDLSLGTHKITNVVNGANPQDATTFLQVFTSPTFSDPTLTGVPTGPTAAPLTSNTQLATTAYADLAVAVLAGVVAALDTAKAPLASPALTGIPTAPTAPTATDTTQLATTEFVQNVAMNSAVPSQAGHTGELLLTDGTDASWTPLKTVNSESLIGTGNVAVQEVLVSGVNIKTVDGTSILSAGNIETVATGDILLSTRELTAPDWLPADGNAFLQASYPDLYAEVGLLPDGTFTKLANPGTLPASAAYGVAFSSDSTYMAVAHGNSPYVTIYKRSGDTYTKLADPAALPASTGYSVAFSPDDTYLVVGATTAILIYKRSGDTFTKLDGPGDMPSGAVYGCAFSPDGIYLAVAHSSGNFLTIYKRSGDVFAKLTDPAALPPDDGKGVAFSPDGAYLAVAHFASPAISIYSRSGDTFTKIANPATLPLTNGISVSFSPCGRYLAVGQSNTPFMLIYKREGAVFTALANPVGIPGGSGDGISFSPASGDLAVVQSTTPYVCLYTRSGDIFTRAERPDTLPAGQSSGCQFSPDGKYLAVAHGTSPYITVYKTMSYDKTTLFITPDAQLGVAPGVNAYIKP